MASASKINLVGVVVPGPTSTPVHIGDSRFLADDRDRARELARPERDRRLRTAMTRADDQHVATPRHHGVRPFAAVRRASGDDPP